MKVYVFASGSSGNCLLVSDDRTNLLIDAGISMRRITEALARIGLTMREIGGVLITHEHSDHVCGLKMLAKYYSLPVYAPHTVASRIRSALPDIESCLRIIPIGERFAIDSLSVMAFHTPHDTDESVGYRIEGSGIFALATDMGCVTEEITTALIGADTVLIESNHDEEMLRMGPYPFQLKRRILSDHGHLSNDHCAGLAAYLADNGTKRIILGHLSRENNTPALAMRTAEAALTGKDVQLFCAPVLGCLIVEAGVNELCSE